jgi:hypothetical protein
VQALLKDRRRSQRGSVLSGVLIITAFLAIISGGLMTELSTNFLLSRNLVTRVATEATVNSAIELAMQQLGSTPIATGCISPGTVSLNGFTAVGSYVSCWPTVRQGETRFSPLSSSSTPFAVDGTHAVLPSGWNDYIVGDTGGTVHDFAFGSTSGWTIALGGSVTAPPAAFTDPSEPPAVSITVPVNNPTSSAPGCSSSQPCVALLSSPSHLALPRLNCYMPASHPVVSTPAEGRNFSNVVYFGDSVGNMYAYDATDDGSCAFLAGAPTTDGDDGVLAAPVVFPGPPGKKTNTDAIYVVVGDSAASRLVEYLYSSGRGGPALTEMASLALPAASARGLAVDGTTLPARLAVTFAGGTVALVQIGSDYSMSVAASGSIGTSISDAPTWCHCPGASNVIGVGGKNGALYLLDASLKTLATLPSVGAGISTTPQSDGVGEWFFGADDGYLYEAQQPAGESTMSVVAKYGGSGGAIGSGAQVGACANELCAYVASTAGPAYMVGMDARDAVLTACLSTAPPACSGQNPRLWTSLEVGESGSPQTVHIQGWSYYSP